ncbi:FAD dependent oxidoreductase [Virgibacillus subterraneus]|uniref:FAD dependent oxidoreductase n=1 Tax=Virgibacillus subterraneus TaxID=621109 RepID=A0A1H9AIU1_9BACI|nr:FAD-dependent oxidoreductase [Virgibacillus subterraneus]SEP76666.1 FAD dependent oxidoreductase [Virgibacillus subterraneus]
MDFSNLNYYVPSKVSNNPQTILKDLIVYGATPAGITASIQAKTMGLTVAIAEFGYHIGGITASGLGATDLGAKDAIGGLSREFYKKIGKYYGKEEQWTFEPKAAKHVFKSWIEEYNIPIYYGQHLKEVEMKDKEVNEIVMENGNTFKGAYYVDASYEGDLMAKSNISYTVGRESNATYDETYNGVRFGEPNHKFEEPVDAYIIEGDKESGLLPGVTEDSTPQVSQGDGDHRIQSYNFRICLTRVPENRVPFPEPPKYDPNRYFLLLRYITAGVWDAMNLHIMLPNGKSDLNNYGAVSTDNIGMNYQWPEGSYHTREEIFQDHVNYNLGMLYFLSNDTRVPLHIREEVSQWGLPKDEFENTGHWPPQLYIRESRRMISDYVMTDNNCLGKTRVDDSIGLASYQMDSHHVRRVVLDGECVNEGDVEVPISPYPISYRSIRPRADECTNLLVPVCLSSSHIAYGSIRMEPVFMIIGQSAGAAAGLAFKNKTCVQNIDYNELKKELYNADQWDPTIEDDPLERMKNTFGK